MKRRNRLSKIFLKNKEEEIVTMKEKFKRVRKMPKMKKRTKRGRNNIKR